MRKSPLKPLWQKGLPENMFYNMFLRFQRFENQSDVNRLLNKCFQTIN